MSDECWKWSACDTATAIADGRVSCLEVMESVVARVRHTNPEINAIVDDLTEVALEKARTLDTSSRRTPRGPLHGVPVTIKENVDQKGYATPNGVVGFKDIIAPDDSPVVKNLLDAGAIVVGRTNTPEFSFRAFTDNPLHGPTMNPWDHGLTPGGSSGGAGAGVAMGYGSIGHGNDIGGSLRIPAFSCGLATVKPSVGRVPAFLPSAAQERGFLAQMMSVQGVIARETRDVRLALESLVRRDPRDPWHLPVPFTGPDMDSPIKVAKTTESYGLSIHPAIIDAIENAARVLTGAGYVVEEVETPSVLELAERWKAMTFCEIGLMMDEAIRTHGSRDIQQIFDHYYEMSDVVGSDDFIRGLADRSRLARVWSLFLEDYPLLLSPFQLMPTMPVDRDLQGLEGVREVFDNLTYSTSMNYLGLPAGIVTGARDGDGLPVGVQIIGRRFREDLILDAAEVIETEIGIPAHWLWERRGES